LASRQGESPASARSRGTELSVAHDPFERGAEILTEWIRVLAQDHEEIRLAIPGGSALEAVARAVPRLGSLWSRVALTWVDERCVPVDDPDSNRGAALRRGIPLGIGGGSSRSLGDGRDTRGSLDARGAREAVPARVIPLFDAGESPEQAKARVERCYARDLRGGLDVVVLGLGPDGHVASLFPGRTAASGFVACVADSPKPPERRITLTRAALLRSAQTLLVAAGGEKRGAVQGVLDGDPRLPATGLPGLVVVCDPASAPEAA
jgi:6-phosphogluconolactonase